MKTDATISMKLNHLSFPSDDVPATAGFFARYLGFAIAGEVSGSYILKRPGFDVVIEKIADYSPVWPRNFHVGFELPDVDEVRALFDRFKAEGIELESEIFNNDRGSRFFCRAPGGVMFELNTRADATPEYEGTLDN